MNIDSDSVIWYLIFWIVAIILLFAHLKARDTPGYSEDEDAPQTSYGYGVYDY